MATAQKEPLRCLTADEQATLERIVKATSERVDRVRRAQALLAVAHGASFTQAGQRAGFRSHTGVAKLVARFNRRGLASLTVAPGRGRRPTDGAAERGQIVATAQQTPRRREDGTATWSLATLQRRLHADG